MVEGIDRNIMLRTMEFALTVDQDETKAYISILYKRYPNKTKRELAEHMISRARWWGAGFGFATGFPSNPWVAAPAAITDMGAVLRTEILLACRIGLLFDPHLLDGPDPPYELLIPIIGGRAASQALGSLVAYGGMGLTRQVIKKTIRLGGLKQFKRAMLKYFGIRVTQRSMISKTVPVVGGLIGGVWNYAELRIVGNRIYTYFEGQELPIDR